MMNSPRIYLDNAATTPLNPEVLEAMLPIMQEHFGNPSSSHAHGRKVKGIIEDAVLAASLDQRMAFWRLRETLPEAQGFEGGSIKHDIAVPLAAVPGLIDAICARVETLVPGARPVPFGHLGDGNLHFNITQPKGMDRAAFMALWDDVGAIVYDETVKLRGSISAEHGIG
ncbi:MAG: aminotransferase class V-fold PLP-dependent enzyme, partial [Sediminibacterium sp.]|nr:aminotransferase class V-fold PLP-dependent enzyme [Sediminibacterium sp.]